MAEAPASSAQWSLLAIVAALVLAVLALYLRTQDAMILIFGGIAILLLAILGFVALGVSRGPLGPPAPAPHVVVKCAACGGANAEDARFCNKCGKALGPA